MTLYDLAIDCRLRSSTGIGRYISELVPRVVAALPERRIVLLGPDRNDPWFCERIAAVRGDVVTIDSEARVFRLAEQRLYRQVARQARVLWCTHFNAPWVFPRKRRLVVNVHDLIPVHVAVGWKGRVRRLGAKWYLAAVRRRADRVLALSQAVADELVQEQRFARASLRPIHLGVAPEWFRAREQAGRSPVAGRFALYLGNISPHKNIAALLAAFAEIMPIVQQRLVIVGERRGFIEQEDFRALVGRLGDRVVFTQRLSDKELRCLFAAADLLVQPSLEEGFGLPPLEAMAAGTPVLTSDCAALRETAAQGAHWFTLKQPGDLVVQLRRLLTDVELRISKVEEGRAWAEHFTWERTAEQTVAVLREVLSV